mmetsp:Transcript_9851/g.22740  ORF Transcript_9851/g.22740 Transcript_9851/m.22740 type:complete len:290 (+) Transcript_9851:363-1232(+)|eukprot:CAMPEP_0116852184 /NCGR_PEP_ID=MMETSP0418-20121206/17149_1 /TAXON_ID=1158023 /ORGANISM="Astrosyne radiata, Strain 13vi08-1A" /LENGTH=289 /DNA_ID=CAMNT_0004484313 /DNA_START=329 /DNA_END=1198 /DNA_ORIENTATION=-
MSSFPESTASRDDEHLEMVRAEIRRVKFEREASKKAYQVHMDDLSEKFHNVKAEFQQKQDKFVANLSIRQYNKCIKDTSGNVPSYLQILQAKVLRSVHHMVVLDNQLRLAQGYAKDLVGFLKRTIREMTLESTDTQARLLNEMALLQRQEEEMQASCQSRIQKQSLELLELRSALSSPETRPKLMRRLSDAEETDLDNLVERLSLMNTQLRSRRLSDSWSAELTVEDIKEAQEEEKASDARSTPLSFLIHSDSFLFRKRGSKKVTTTEAKKPFWNQQPAAPTSPWNVAA